MRIRKLKEKPCEQNGGEAYLASTGASLPPVSPFFPDMLLPAQFFSDRLLVGKASGEMALRWAVFADGLEQYWKLAADPFAHGSSEFQEEEGWVLADDAEWPFSFTNLCESFGLSPQSVRKVLMAWKNAHLSPLREGEQKKEVLQDFPSASGHR